MKMLFPVYNDRLDPGKGWYIMNEELHVSAFQKNKENSFFRLFPDEVKKIPFCELNDGSGNTVNPTLLGVKYKNCDVLVASNLKGPRTYLARVSKEVKFHFRSTEFPQ